MSLLILVLFVAALVFLSMRAAEARQKEIQLLEDAEHFEDNDPRLSEVPAPEEVD